MKALLLFALGVGNVGQLMGPPVNPGGSPPAVTYHILTEAGDNLAAESGSLFVTESAP